MPSLTREQFVERLRAIKVLAMDVDGVLTDDSLFFGPDGFEMKKFNISDGFYMALAMKAGIPIVIVSGRYSPATDSRMKDLGIKHVLQGKRNKVEMIDPLLKELGVDYEQVAYVGNDLLDIKLADKVGLAIAVADASSRYLTVVDYVTARKGGKGAIREIIECYFEAHNIDPLKLIV